MNEYHKIQTVFLRDPETKYKTLLEGQYAKPEFEYLKDCEWAFTEKVDGTNIRVLWDCLTISFRGKTDRAQIPPFLLSQLEKTFVPLIGKISEIFDCPVCLYGEGYGAKIQKGGGNYRPDQGFVLFDVKIGDWWLKREDVEDVAGKLGIEVAPLVGGGTLADMVEIVRDGFISSWGDFEAEGIVARPQVELKARNGERIITKLKTRDFRR
jgi:hypothetical protein